MASGHNWPSTVRLSPKYIQVRSFISPKETDSDSKNSNIILRRNGHTVVIIEPASSTSQEIQENILEKSAEQTIQTPTCKHSLINVLCCVRAGNKNGEVEGINTNSTNKNSEKVQHNHDKKHETWENVDLDISDEDITTEEQDVATNDEEENPRYLHYMLKLMYNLGLSTYKIEHDSNNSKRWTEVLSHFLHKLLYWTIVAFALLRSLSITKYNWFVFVGEGGIKNLADVGFGLVPLLAEIYIAHLFAFQHENLTSMLCTITEFERFVAANKQQKNPDEARAKNTNRTLKVLTFVAVLACTAYNGRLLDYSHPLTSLTPTVLQKSETLSHALFVWTFNGLNETDVQEQLFNDYGSKLTTTTASMAAIQCIMEFCSDFKMEIIINLMIAAGWCLKHHIGKQARRLQNIDFASYTNGNDHEELMSPNGDWAKYKELKRANKVVNAVFDILLKFLHVHTISLVAYFLMHILDNNVNTIRFLVLVYKIGKLTFAYYVAKQSHGYKYFKRLATILFTILLESNLPIFNFLLKVPTILDEMRREPLGLGSGEFMIGETFVLKLIGFAGSLFVFQVDKSD